MKNLKKEKLKKNSQNQRPCIETNAKQTTLQVDLFAKSIAQYERIGRIDSRIFFYDSLNIYYISEPTVDNNKIILDLEIIVTQTNDIFHIYSLSVLLLQEEDYYQIRK